MDLKRRSPSADRAAPVLLPAFAGLTVTVVAAVVLIGRTDSDWADAGAVLLLLGALGSVLGALMRLLHDEAER
jgi:hypothetical protein